MPKTANKPVIAVDIDDVLAANAEGFIKFSNQRWGTNLTPDDYTEHWAELWGIGHEEVEKRRDEIIDVKLFVSHRFFEEAKPALRELSKNYQLIIVSSRGPRVQKDTLDWIKKEYGHIFSGIYFADMWGRKDLTLEERLRGTKTDVLARVKADYLIDDQPKHCYAAAKVGITSLLFGNYKWANEAELRPNMVRAKNWQEVLAYFNGRS